MVCTMTIDPIFENFVFIAKSLIRLGFRGNLLSSKAVYDFLRPYLAGKCFDTGDDMYNELWSRCHPAKKAPEYTTTLSRQLGQILAVNSYRIDAKDFHNLEA